MDMKRIFLLPLFALLFSCGGTTSKYEKLIADVVQTERGVKIDLNFKADKLEEISQISVADSIKIITDSFNAERNSRRLRLKKRSAYLPKALKKQKLPADFPER